MTTYTTPPFANGVSGRSVRPDPSLNGARAASAASDRTAGVSSEAAVLAAGPTPDWQPGAGRGGVPKAAIGALGAALVGGVALALVLMAPAHKAAKPVASGSIAQAAARDTAAQKPVDPSAPALDGMNSIAPAAGNAAAGQQAAAPTAEAVPADTHTTTPGPTPDTPAPTPARP